MLKKYIFTYTLTKNWVEKALSLNRGDVPLIIIRPSAVYSSYKEPVPGWIDTISAGGIVSYPVSLGLTRYVN